MKILHVVPSLMANGGGTSEYVPMAALAQLHAGAEVAIAFRDCGNVSGRTREAEMSGVRLVGCRFDVRCWNPLRFNLEFCRMLWREVAKSDVAIMHCNWMFPVWWAAHVARKLHKPYMMMPHGSFAPERLKKSAWKKKLIGWIDRHYARHAAAIWVTSDAEAEGVRKYVPGVKTEVFPIGLDCERFRGFEVPKFRGSGVSGDRTLLFFSRISPIKGLDMLAEAWGGVSRVGGVDRARQKIDAWMRDVTTETFGHALKRLVEEKRQTGEYRFRAEGEVGQALSAASRFFAEFSRKIVVLSDGRCVYFAPDVRAKARNGDDLSRCWAEYSFHAVSNGGARVKGKGYSERWYNPHKAANANRIEGTLTGERCYVRLGSNAHADSILFAGEIAAGFAFSVITRLDEFGNMDANLTEVTFEASSKKAKKLPRLVPLAEAVRTVVHHQTTAGSYPPNANIIAKQGDVGKGTRWKLLIVGPDDRGYTEEIKKVFAAKCPAGSYEFRGAVYGDEKFKLLASADAFVLPTRNENWGIAVAEAMASGLPVICTKGAPWASLETAKAGRWVDISAAGIQKGIEDVLALSDEERRAMGERGRKWVKENLDWAAIAKKMVDCLSRLSV